MLGTFLLVLVCVASSQLAPGVPSIVYGLVYGALVAALGHISGGHFNPAVTIGHWVTHRLGTFETLIYWGAQLAGACGAAYLLRLYLSESMWTFLTSDTFILAAGVTRGPAMLIEASMTFVLVLTLWVTTMNTTRYWLSGLAAAVVIVYAGMLGEPFTGGAMNPARAFGPALAARQWAYQAVYWIGPLAGGVAAASLYDLLFHRARRRPVAAETQS